MRRFGNDQIDANFSPHYRAHGQANRQPVRGPYSHIQVVPKLEPSGRHENVAPPVTFRKSSYSQEAANSMALLTGSGSLPPTASLANMTLGTTFAAKARAAELNAVRSHKAKAKESEANDLDTSMASTSSGPLKLTKPRTRSKGWKPLNLDEIPESALEVERIESRYPSTSTSSNTRTSTPNKSNANFGPATSGAQSSPQVLYHPSQRMQSNINLPAQHVPYYFSDAQPVTAIPRFTNEMATQNAFISPEHFRQQMHQFNQLALQQQQQQRQHQGRYVDSAAPSSTMALYQNPAARDSELFGQQANVSTDDPFVEMPAALRQSTNRYHSVSDQRSEVTAPSTQGSSPEVPGKMDYEFKFPTQQHRVSLPHPPGLTRSNLQAQTLHDTPTSTTERASVPTADPYRRDPKPYTSFARTSDDSSRKEQLLQHLQQVVDVSQARGNVPSSMRTVLFDPVAQNTSTSTGPHEPRVSQGGNEFLKASEPLPWKNRPVDIYNMKPPAPVVPHLPVHERPATITAAESELDGNAYIRSLISNPESAEERLKNSEAWWNHDGRGQEQMRAYLEQVADQHKKTKSSREYENIKRALERQGSYRDEWSDDSDATTIPKGPTEGEVINRLMVPVIANLRSYAEDSGASYFNKFSKAPAWAVDNSADGNKSFFGEDWGKPPSRVGRDPRYRPTFHEGRYTVFEPTDGRVSGRGGW